MDLLIRGFARGSFRIERGSWADYRALEHFHYINRRPAVPIGVWRIRFRPPGTRRRILAAVGVASFPTIRSRARECAIGLAPVHKPRPSERETRAERALRRQRSAAQIRWLNRHVRRITRVIVAPPFRGLGLGAALVRRMCCCCKTRYVEAMAIMGAVSPLFEQAGMTRAGGSGEVVYFLYRKRHRPRTRRTQRS